MLGLNIVKKEAKKLRSRFANKERVIDLYRIAESNGIKIVDENFEENISGLFVKENGGYIIAVNQNHSKTRKRFTIAHEIGHFILHKEENLHYDPNTKVDTEIFLRADGVISGNETEANHFAAELLMPEEMVCDDFKKMPNVIQLASMYEVSEQAMMYRLINLGLM